MQRFLKWSMVTGAFLAISGATILSGGLFSGGLRAQDCAKQGGPQCEVTEHRICLLIWCKDFGGSVLYYPSAGDEGEPGDDMPDTGSEEGSGGGGGGGW